MQHRPQLQLQPLLLMRALPLPQRPRLPCLQFLQFPPMRAPRQAQQRRPFQPALVQCQLQPLRTDAAGSRKLVSGSRRETSVRHPLLL